MALVCLATLLIAPASAQTTAVAAQPPLTVNLLVSSRPDACYDPGDLAAITTLARREEERINRQGGIHGRRLDVRILDDNSNEAKTIANLRAAIAEPTTLAIIGHANSNRAKAAFDTVGKDLRDSAIPFVSNISVTSLFKDFANVLTTQVSQDEERVPVMAQFIRQTRFQRVAFVGLKDFVFSSALGDGLRKRLGEPLLAADHRIGSPKNDELDQATLDLTVADLKAKAPDLVVVGFGGKRAATLVSALTAAGMSPALFVSGRIDNLPEELVNAYPNAMYQLAWDRLPEADNDRLRRLLSRDPPQEWVFEGRKNSGAPGWANGQCKPRPDIGDAVPDPFESANQRAIGLGAQYADMVALVATAARAANPGSSTVGLRRRVLSELTTTYAAGHGVFKGSFETWSFQPKSRTAERTPFVVVRPKGLGRTQLAPIQFVRAKDGTLREIETLYLDVDLIRAERIEDNDKTFFAELYVSMRSKSNSGIEQVELTNAFLDPRSGGRQITVEMLHDGGESETYPAGMKVYKVTGRFTFEPEMSRYPFDTQRFSVDVQPKRTDRPFVIQPPPLDLRDKSVVADGWDVKSQYVGYSADFVPLVDTMTHEPSVVPFYKASFAWLMKRETTDYFLRVVVPLGFIFIIAYLSFFIPKGHFEAVVTIQVTALLSAVALYLSLPKLDSGDATISDRLFVFSYMMVSLMIGMSILRVSRFAQTRRWVKRLVRIGHVFGIPLLVVAMTFYVYRLTAV